MIELRVERLGEAPRVLELDLEQISIGRRQGNTVVLADKEVSGHHALIERRGDHYVLVDRSSTNGTFVDGDPIAPETPFTLRDGYRVTIGPFTLTFVAAGSAADAEATFARPAPVERSVERLGAELHAAYAEHLFGSPEERAAVLRRLLDQRRREFGDAQMVRVLDEILEQHRRGPPEPAPGDDVSEDFYPAGYRALCKLSRTLLDDERFAVVEEIDRFEALIATFVQLTCEWIVRSNRARQTLKQGFAMPTTTLGEATENPLMTATDVGMVARQLLDWSDHNKQPAAAAQQLGALFGSVLARQSLVTRGVELALQGLLRRLDPDSLELTARDAGGALGALATRTAANSRLWAVYRAAWNALTDMQKLHDEVISPAMAEAASSSQGGGRTTTIQ